MKFKIFAGLGGGFGGAEFQYIKEFASLEDAEEAAWSAAADIYDDHAGSNGLRTVSDIVNEDYSGEEFLDYDLELKEMAVEQYFEEREPWLDYYVEEVTDDTQEDEDD